MVTTNTEYLKNFQTCIIIRESCIWNLHSLLVVTLKNAFGNYIYLKKIKLGIVYLK